MEEMKERKKSWVRRKKGKERRSTSDADSLQQDSVPSSKSAAVGAAASTIDLDAFTNCFKREWEQNTGQKLSSLDLKANVKSEADAQSSSSSSSSSSSTSSSSSSTSSSYASTFSSAIAETKKKANVVVNGLATFMHNPDNWSHTLPPSVYTPRYEDYLKTAAYLGCTTAKFITGENLERVADAATVTVRKRGVGC